MLLDDNVTCRPLVHEKNNKAQSSTNRDESNPNYFFDFISLLPFRCDINYIINAHSQSNNREKFHRGLFLNNVNSQLLLLDECRVSKAALANVARCPHESKPSQQDAADKHHPKLEMNVH
jgi:hypothetical protein